MRQSPQAELASSQARRPHLLAGRRQHPKMMLGEPPWRDVPHPKSSKSFAVYCTREPCSFVVTDKEPNLNDTLSTSLPVDVVPAITDKLDYNLLGHHPVVREGEPWPV